MASDRDSRGGCGSALGLTARRFARPVLLVLFVLISSTAAQQPSIRPYESEEDLWEALNDGELNFEEFVELLDLARSAADSLLTPRTDWEALPGSDAGYLAPPDSSQTLIQTSTGEQARVDIPWVSSLRMGVDADLNEPSGADGYSVIRLQQGALRGVFDFEHGREEGGEWRRRSLVWQPKNYSIVLGSFEPRWGRGLVVGRRSRVVRSADRSGSIWQPKLGRFDGLSASAKIGSTFRAESFVSYMDSDSLGELALGLHLLTKFRGLQLGIAVASSINGLFEETESSSVVRNSYNEPVVGGHVQFDHGERTFLGEIAIANDNSTAKAAEIIWPLASGRFHARGWSYGSGFINPIGGGPGHSDTREIELHETSRKFSSRTAGERGFDFTTRIAVAPNLNLRWDWMSHREAPGATLEHGGVFRAEIRRPSFRSTPFVRAQVNEDETESFSIGNYLWWGPAAREVNFRLEFGTHYDDEVQFIRAGIGAKLQLNRIVRLAPALRWVDPNLDTPSDGYWYLYLTETVLPIQGARVEMAMVWKKYEESGRDDLVELRVRGFVK